MKRWKNQRLSAQGTALRDRSAAKAARAPAASPQAQQGFPFTKMQVIIPSLLLPWIHQDIFWRLRWGGRGGLLQKRVSPFIIPFQKTFLFTYSASHCFAKPFSWAVCIDLTFALYNSCFLICLAGWFLGFLLWACQGDSINTVSRKKKKEEKNPPKKWKEH